MAKGSMALSTGEVAKICRVASRTVSKWIDSGKLRGYRIPGSRDRRVPREQLVRFLRENGMAPEWLDGTGGVLLVGCGPLLADRLREYLPEAEGWRLIEAATAFDAGRRVAGATAVVIDCAPGRGEALAIAASLSRLEQPPWVALLASEDEADEGGAFLTSGAAAVFRHPFDPALLAEAARAAVGGEGNGGGR